MNMEISNNLDIMRYCIDYMFNNKFNKTDYTQITKESKMKPHPKLTLKIAEFDRGLMIEILYMDERFRDTSKSHGSTFTASNGFKVRSSAVPQLDKDEVFLRGSDKSLANWPMICRFDSKEEKDQYKKKLFSALDEWAKNWEGFKEKEIKTVPNTSVNIVSFY